MCSSYTRLQNQLPVSALGDFPHDMESALAKAIATQHLRIVCPSILSKLVINDLAIYFTYPTTFLDAQMDTIDHVTTSSAPIRWKSNLIFGYTALL